LDQRLAKQHLAPVSNHESSTGSMSSWILCWCGLVLPPLSDCWCTVHDCRLLWMCQSNPQQLVLQRAAGPACQHCCMPTLHFISGWIDRSQGCHCISRGQH
jgi:hypothetical protein